MSIKQQLQPFQLVSCWYHVLHKTHTCIHFSEKVKNSSPKKLSANCWSTVGQLLADSRPTVGRLSFTAFYENRKKWRTAPPKNCRPTVGQQLADSIPTVSRQTFRGALLHFYPIFQCISFSFANEKVVPYEQESSQLNKIIPFYMLCNFPCYSAMVQDCYIPMSTWL